MNDHEQIIMVLAAIPAGNVCTYGLVAERAGLKGKSRLVGYVLKHLPTDSRIPWHRVINSQGKISFPVNSEKYLEQKSKLEAEGITLINGRVNLKHFLWSS